jgi:hypothetical protein
MDFYGPVTLKKLELTTVTFACFTNAAASNPCLLTLKALLPVVAISI